MDVRRPWWPPTLDDVAARAGVSKATASRALAASGAGSRPAATSRVERAAADLGYRASRRDSPRLLVLASDVSRTGYWATLSGIVSACQDLDVDLSVHVLTGGPDRWRESLLGAHDVRLDGLVVLEFDTPSTEILTRIPLDMPVAVAGGYPGEAEAPPRAWTDDHAGAVTATRHLLELGHRNLRYVGVPPAGHPDPRVAGWREVMAEAGLPAPDPRATGWSATTGLRAAEAIAESGATAVLCGNDDLALGLITGLGRLGLRVPDDVSVVGMDDHPHSVAASPALTTVRLDFAAVGEAAARLALGDLEAHDVEVPSELIERASTASPFSLAPSPAGSG